MGRSEGRGEVGRAEAFARLPAGYQPHDAPDTVLHRVVRENLATFLARAQAEGGLPKHVVATFYDYLRCGDPSYGFGRLKCETCGHELFVPFSCKRKGLCPSCGGRWMADVAAHLVNSVIPEIPVRQWVLSVPFRDRYRLARNPSRMRQVKAIFLRAVIAFYRRRAKEHGLSRPQFGAVVFPQYFGSSINLHPHWHALWADGVFVKAPQGSVSFRRVGEPAEAEVTKVAETVALRIGRLARRLGWDTDDDQPDDVLGRAVAASMHSPLAFWTMPPQAPAAPRPVPLCAQVDGYSVHANVAVRAQDRRALESLLRYMARPPFAQDRLSVDEQGRVVYHLTKRRHDGAKVLVLDPLDFLARLAALIPHPKTHGLTYHGIFGPAAKDRAAIVPAPQECPPSCPQLSAQAGTRGGCETAISPSVPAAATRKESERRARRRLAWADLLERCFEIDVTQCGKCGGNLRLVSLIEDKAVAKKILDHLGLPSTPPPIANARPPPQAAFEGWDTPWVDNAVLAEA